MASSSNSLVNISHRLSQVMLISPQKEFLERIRTDDELIDLSQLQYFARGGTHIIYKLNSDSTPTFLLKVMIRTRGVEASQLETELQETNDKYQILYQAFGERRCLLEYRKMEFIKEPFFKQSSYRVVPVAFGSPSVIYA